MIWVRTRLGRSSIGPVPLRGSAILVPLMVPFISLPFKADSQLHPRTVAGIFHPGYGASRMRIPSRVSHRVQIRNWRIRGDTLAQIPPVMSADDGRAIPAFDQHFSDLCLTQKPWLLHSRIVKAGQRRPSQGDGRLCATTGEALSTSSRSPRQSKLHAGV